MRIAWLIFGEIQQRGANLDSAFASIRYRALAPARHLHGRGHQVDLISLGTDRRYSELSAFAETDVVVVSKVLYDHCADVIRNAKQQGARILLDVCDNYFEVPEQQESFRALFELADHLVASTRTMAEVIHQQTGRSATVIDEPYESPGAEPRFAPTGDHLRLLWYGGVTNRQTLADMVPQLARLSDDLPLSLHVVTTSHDSNIHKFVRGLNDQFGPRMTTTFSEWSVQTTWQAIDECDIVVIPSCAGETYRVKSANRVVEPLHVGRFVAAYPLPSYRDFSDFIWLGENVADGVRWAVENPQQAIARIQQGQSYVNETLAPEVIGHRWESEILSAFHGRTEPPRPKILNNVSQRRPIEENA